MGMANPETQPTLAAPEPPHPAPEAEEVYRRWVRFLDGEFQRHGSQQSRAEIVRDQLVQLYTGRPHGGQLNLTLTSELPGNVLMLALDPMNVTLEAEHFAEVDRERFNRLKPLLWFWKMFDRSPVGLNHWLGLRFRSMLAHHIFQHVGRGVKICRGVDLAFGYNLSIGAGALIHQGVLLNDRGSITVGEGAVIGSYARILSHVHDSENYNKVRLEPTTIGAGARIASHAIVLAGRRVGDGEVVGSFPTETA